MKPPIRVRPARQADRASCLAIWEALQAEQAARDPAHQLAPDAAECWRTDWSDWLSSRVDAVLVAERAGEVVGMITAHAHRPPPLYRDELRCWLDGLYVRPQARRSGVATALLDAAEAFATGIGAAAVEAGIQAQNAAMQALWARRGGRTSSVVMRREIGQRGTGRAGCYYRNVDSV